MLGFVTGLVVLIVWWTLALLVGLWRVKPDDKRYREPRGPGVGTIVKGGIAGTIFALFTHNGAEGG